MDRGGDRVVQLAEPAPGVRGLQRLDHRPHPHQGVAQVGAVVAAVLPGAAGRLAEIGGAAGAQRAHGERAAARHRLLVALVARRSSGRRRGAGAGRGSRRRACPAAPRGPRAPASPASPPRRRRGRRPAGRAPGPGRGRSPPRPRSSPPSRPRSGAPAAPGAPARSPRGSRRARPRSRRSARAAPARPPCAASPASAGRRPGAIRRTELTSGVEAPVAARGLPGGAGRGEAADRRVLEGLREVAEGEPLRAQRRLRLGPAQAGAEARRSASGGRPRRRAGAARSRLISRWWEPRSGSTPPTTLVPPPNGTTATPSRGADVEHAAQGVGVGGHARRHPGAASRLPPRIRARST